MKRLFWILATFILLFGTLSAPVQLKADGTPMPTCPTGKVGCKPSLTAGTI